MTSEDATPAEDDQPPNRELPSPDAVTPRVEPSPPISYWALGGAALLVLAVTGALLWVLLGIAHQPGLPLAPGAPPSPPQASVQIDAWRTALTAGAGTGGATALLLAFRRQRHTEQVTKITYDATMIAERDRRADLAQRGDAASAVAEDARERRVTELYAAASEQLGSEKAPVRLAGLYALERLAQSTPAQRQTTVNVWCAYLRMPYTPPVQAVGRSTEEAKAAFGQAREEQEVRLTAQRLLATHLRPGDDPDQPVNTYWPEIVDLDLTGAQLERPDLRRCRFPRATTLVGASFTGDAWFSEASFVHEARFDGASFAGAAQFTGTRFVGAAWFTDVSFAGIASFERAKFADFAWFSRARFADAAWFDFAAFAHFTWLHTARARTSSDYEHVWPSNWTLSERADEAGYHQLMEIAKSEDGTST